MAVGIGLQGSTRGQGDHAIDSTESFVRGTERQAALLQQLQNEFVRAARAAPEQGAALARKTNPHAGKAEGLNEMADTLVMELTVQAEALAALQARETVLRELTRVFSRQGIQVSTQGRAAVRIGAHVRPNDALKTLGAGVGGVLWPCRSD